MSLRRPPCRGTDTRSRGFLRGALCALVLCAAWGGAAYAIDPEQAPIQYSRATPENCISRLQARINGGQVTLSHDEDHGYLKSVLKELNVAESSQVLVFSKTSFQRNRIAPATPRAIYFNDEVYVGFCRGGDVLEISAVDPGLGTVFYTLDQEPAGRPRVLRQTDNCLICHGSTMTRGVPGHLVRSVYADREGNPILSLGTERVDHTTPFGHRWGGWYVTGTSGRQTHRGNQVLPARAKEPPADNPQGVNVTDLRDRFTVANYLTPHSDLVALLVLEHQVEMHNRIARAALETRMAMHQQVEFDRILGRKTEGLSESAARRIESCCEPLVQYLFFCEEAPLTEKVTGTSTFAQDFAARGRKDARGRSLREFDLTRRLFKYPCSYLVQSESFERLPREANDYVERRMREVLSGQDQSPRFAHLSAEDRQAIQEILRDTSSANVGAGRNQ